MNKLTIILCVLCLTIFNSCKKDEFNGASTSIPTVPVTVSNIYNTFNGVPTVSTTASGGGAITITLSVPAESARTIKEITRVGISTTPNNYKVVEVGTGLYNTSPIASNGKTVSFTTSLTEYTAKTGLAAPAAPGTATSFLARYFIFLVTLDNGDQIFPVGVRVYVDK